MQNAVFIGLSRPVFFILTMTIEGVAVGVAEVEVYRRVTLQNLCYAFWRILDGTVAKKEAETKNWTRVISQKRTIFLRQKKVLEAVSVIWGSKS